MKDLERRVNLGERPIGDTVLNKALYLGPGSDDWSSLECFLKGRVGFKETAAVIGGGKVKTEALRPEPVTRRKLRNPTGYQKFSFKGSTCFWRYPCASL